MSTGRSPEYDDTRDERPLSPVEAQRPANVVLEPNEARGGSTHHNMRYVLGISIAILVIVFAGLWFFSAMGIRGNVPTDIQSPAARSDQNIGPGPAPNGATKP